MIGEDVVSWPICEGWVEGMVGRTGELDLRLNSCQITNHTHTKAAARLLSLIESRLAVWAGTRSW